MIRFSNAWLKWGAVILVFGCGPLQLCILGQAVGLVSRTANPIGLGLLFLFSACLASACLLIGAIVWAWAAVRGPLRDRR